MDTDAASPLHRWTQMEFGEVIAEIQDFRHRMRENGQRGACYEVSQFIQWRFGLPAQEGVYQLPTGEPICLHRWNLTPNGDILDGTADQFCEGRDVDLIPSGNPRTARYRPIWTIAFNPNTVAWHQAAPWTGLADEEWWAKNSHLDNCNGWWLKETGPFIAWRTQMEERYASFRANPMRLIV
jgi:hypothetical protein